MYLNNLEYSISEPAAVKAVLGVFRLSVESKRE